MNAITTDIYAFFEEDVRLRREREAHRAWLRRRVREFFEREIDRYREESGDTREISPEQMEAMVERRVREEMGEVD